MALYNQYPGEPTYIAGFPSSYARILKALVKKPATTAHAAAASRVTINHVHMICTRLRRRGLIATQPQPLGVPRLHRLTPKGLQVVQAWEFLRSLGPSRNGGRR